MDTLMDINGASVIIFSDIAQKEMLNIQTLMSLLGPEVVLGRQLYIKSFSTRSFKSYIRNAAEEMQEKIRMRKKREVLISFFERSDEAALRVFANQLAIVKY